MTSPARNVTATDLTAEIFGLDDMTLIVMCSDSYMALGLPLHLRATLPPGATKLTLDDHTQPWPVTIVATFNPGHLKGVKWTDLDLAEIKYGIEKHLWRIDRKNVRLRWREPSCQCEGTFQLEAKFV